MLQYNIHAYEEEDRERKRDGWMNNNSRWRESEEDPEV